MAAVCFAPVRSRRVRLTRLDACGLKVVGAKSTVSTGFVSVAHKPEFEDGDDHVVKDAWGDFCVNEKDPDRLKRVGLEIAFCNVDPDVFDITTGSRTILAAAGDSGIAATGASIGYAVNEAAVETGYSLELWSKASGAVCGAAGTQVWIYTVYPYVKNGRIGDQDFQNGTSTFTITGQTQAVGAAYSIGFYEAGLKALTAGEHYAQYLTLVQPPAAACGAVALA